MNGLRLHLGDAPGRVRHPDGGVHPVKTYDKSRDSPAKQRRRERRAALRENENTEVMEKEVKECAFEEKANDCEKEETTEKMETEVVVEVQDSSEKEDTENIETAEQVDTEIVVTPEKDDAETFKIAEKVEKEMVVEDTGTIENGNEIIETIEKVDSVCSTSNDVNENVNQPRGNDVIADGGGKETLSEVIEVFATAVLDNSPSNKVFKHHIDSISQIIDYKEHLQRNIENFNFGNISTWELNDRKFKHQIQVILKVKTGQLWESARSYLWRHLGSSTWTLQDGTEVSLIRIHQR